MKIKYGMFCLAVWMLTLSVILSAVSAFAEEEGLEPEASEQTTAGSGTSDQSEAGSDVLEPDPSGTTEAEESGDEPNQTDAPSVSDAPETDPPATQAPVTTPEPVTTVKPSTTVPATTKTVVTTKPVTTKPVTTKPVTTKGATTTDNRSTEAPVLTGVPQVSGYYPLSTGASTPPATEAAGTTEAILTEPPVDTAEGTSTDSGMIPAVSEGAQTAAQSGQSAQQSAASSQTASTERSDDAPSVDGERILMLALIFGGTCVGAAVLLVFLKIKNQSIV